MGRNAAFLIGLLGVACTSASELETSIEAPAVDDERSTSMASASNGLGLAVYQHLRHEEGNIAYAPASLSIALSMAYLGARGATAEEMALVMRLPSDADAVHDGWATLLSNWEGQDDVHLSVANRFVGEKTFPFVPSFSHELESHYGASLGQADFRNDFEAERARINDWVAKNTEGFINDLFPPDSFESGTVSALVNAMYFSGGWQTSFDEPGTLRPFFGPEGEFAVPMMETHGAFAQVFVDGARVLEMPYDGGRKVALIALTDDGSKLATLEDGLDAARFNAWIDALATAEVEETEVLLPRFKVVTPTLELKRPLIALGMETAFSKQADFSGMGERPVTIDDVFQKVVIEMSEDGTEAAAATGVEGVEYDREVAFRADRPFLFFVYDKGNDVILFAGRVTDPRIE